MIEKGGKNYAFFNIFGKAPTEAYTDTCMAALSCCRIDRKSYCRHIQLWLNDCSFYPHTASDRRSCMLSGLDTGRNTGHIVFDPVCTAICWYGGGSNPGRNPKQSNGIYSFVEKKERRVKNIELHT